MKYRNRRLILHELLFTIHLMRIAHCNMYHAGEMCLLKRDNGNLMILAVHSDPLEHEFKLKSAYE